MSKLPLRIPRELSGSPVALTDEDDLIGTTLRNSLLDGLGNVGYAGVFATSCSYESFVHPGIRVDGAGLIQMPLSNNQMQVIVAASDQTASELMKNKNKEASIWEIGTEHLSFENGAWPAWLAQVAESAAKDLGVTADTGIVRAVLRKMILSGKGGKLRLDENKGDIYGAFGTMVICLPSEHAGGTVHTEYSQSSNTFETAALSSFGLTSVAWYGDVACEIEPIVSGCRWLLVYSLVNTSTKRMKYAAGLDEQVQRFQNTLLSYKSDPHMICYALERQYTDSELSLSTLKGRDHPRVQVLWDACKASGEFIVCLANMVKTVIVSEEDKDGTRTSAGGDESVLELKMIRNIYGSVLVEDIIIHEEYILQRTLYDREPDDRLIYIYPDGGQANVDRFKDTVAVVLPKSSLAEIAPNHISANRGQSSQILVGGAGMRDDIDPPQDTERDRQVGEVPNKRERDNGAKSIRA